MIDRDPGQTQKTEDVEEDFLPPVVQHDYRPKPSGIRRPILFVREQSPERAVPSTSSIGSDYLSLVLCKPGTTEEDSVPLCPVCKLPLSSSNGKSSHDTSIAHQVCLEHKHPPSNIDRSRMGYKYINSQGWDPDDRKGLGKAGKGIRFPIIPKEKKDKLGIGARLKMKPADSEPKPKPLNAKQIRKQEAENRRKKQKLERMFYSNGDLEKYLGEDA